MQYNKSEKKKILLDALAKTVKELRGKKSRFMFASENDISTSIISTVERGIKDPQLTTLYKIAEACNISLIDFVVKLSENLPKNFSLIDK